MDALTKYLLIINHISKLIIIGSIDDFIKMIFQNFNNTKRIIKTLDQLNLLERGSHQDLLVATYRNRN